MALHTPAIQRKFFALVKDLHLEADIMKERAIRKFDVACFNDLTTANLVYLIDRLLQYARRKGIDVENY